MKTFIVWGDDTNESFNKILGEGYEIIDKDPIKTYQSDDLGTFENIGVIFTQLKNLQILKRHK